VERAFASVTPGCFKERRPARETGDSAHRLVALPPASQARIFIFKLVLGFARKASPPPQDPLKKAAQPVKRATARIASWRCRLLRRLESLFSKWSWGFARKASLHPRLYAVACFAGYIKRFRRPCFAGYKLNTD